jgi:hypothetical protein
VDELSWELDVPVRRVAPPFSPIPFGRELEHGLGRAKPPSLMLDLLVIGWHMADLAALPSGGRDAEGQPFGQAS